MSPELLARVAARFKALADPARLSLLAALRSGEKTVTDLVVETGLSQANTSRHLAQLRALGFVRRRRDGLFTCYALRDAGVLALCDVMCARVEAEVADEVRVVGRGRRRA